MATVDTHSPGTFCWLELATTDQNAAKSFYQSLFGWSSVDNPMGPDEVYTMFTLEGRNVGACYKLKPDMLAQGVPTHWMLYIATPNVDETAAKVEPAGGKLFCQPFDVMEHGRMAVLQDPGKAVISMWQAKAHKGIGLEGVPGTLCWADRMGPDQAGAVKFYESVFGWKVEAGKDSGYMHIKAGDKHIGGIPAAEFVPANAPPHWLSYIYVANCDESTTKAKDLGANVFMPATTMEGVGRWSVVADPTGGVFALFQSIH